MGLIPSNFPELLRDQGLLVYVFPDWEDVGAHADHQIIALHDTASSEHTRPQDDAAYCHHGSPIAPCYNILCDRGGVVWLLSRNLTNNAGRISSVAFFEAMANHANLTPARQRGLKDDTTRNRNIFAIAGQNNGVGEPWNWRLTRSMGIVTLVAMECLDIPLGGVTDHKALTPRKIDTSGPGSPNNWHEYLAGLYLEISKPIPVTPAPSDGDPMELCALNNGRGYYVLSSDGAVFAYGEAEYLGGMNTVAHNAPMTGMGVTKNDDGYWMCAADGGVFAFGAAPFLGSMGGVPLNKPIVGMAVTPSGNGYWLLGGDGGIFAFGDAQMMGAPTQFFQ